jgi:hypothetical protein
MKSTRYPLTLAVASLLALGGVAQANTLPQPDLLLYGKVVRGADVLTDGLLEWTYTPIDGGVPLRVRSELRPVTGPKGEELSYSAQIPVAFPLGGGVLMNGAVPLTGSALRLAREVTYNGKPVYITSSVLGESFALNIDDHLGYVERVDLAVVDLEDCCPGDANRDGVVTIADYVGVRNNFGDPTPTLGDANCDSFVNLGDYLTVRDRLGNNCPVSGKDDPKTPPAPPIHPVGRDASFQLVGKGSTSTAEAYAVKVSLSAARAVGVCTVYIEYDPAYLEYAAGATARQYFDNPTTTADPRVVHPGFIAITAGSQSGLKGSAAEVAYVQFKPVKAGRTTVSLVSAGPFAVAALDDRMDAVASMVQGGDLQVDISATATTIEDWQNLE